MQTKQYNIKIPAKLNSNLTAVAKGMDVSKAEVIRLALSEFIKANTDALDKGNRIIEAEKAIRAS